MKHFQVSTSVEIQTMLEKRGYWSHIQDNKLLYKIQASVPSKMVDGGTSQIVTCYDEHLRYLCTLHRVITSDKKKIHEDIKNAFIDGKWYRVK